jgi:hypothetical protein
LTIQGTDARRDVLDLAHLPEVARLLVDRAGPSLFCNIPGHDAGGMHGTFTVAG